jgi:hypothetical protein
MFFTTRIHPIKGKVGGILVNPLERRPPSRKSLFATNLFFRNFAESVRIMKREGNRLEMDASVRSFGKVFGVKMKTEILPGRGFISDNDSYEFGTSGHEELLLSEHPEGTLIDYTYQVSIHKPWLRIIATPLIKWYSMKFWEKAVIGELRKMFGTEHPLNG